MFFLAVALCAKFRCQFNWQKIIFVRFETLSSLTVVPEGRKPDSWRGPICSSEVASLSLARSGLGLWDIFQFSPSHSHLRNKYNNCNGLVGRIEDTW